MDTMLLQSSEAVARDGDLAGDDVWRVAPDDRARRLSVTVLDRSRHRLAEDLFHAVRLSISAALQRGLGRAHLTLLSWARRISVVCNAIAAAKDYSELRARTRELLPQLGYRSYFLCVYDTPGDSSQARLVVSSEPTGVDLALTGRVFRGRALLPPALTTVDGIGHAFAVLPLLGARAVVGHVLFVRIERASLWLPKPKPVLDDLSLLLDVVRLPGLPCRV